MRLAQPWMLLTFACVTAPLAIDCGGDDSEGTGSGGTAGSSGSLGTGGKAGSSTGGSTGTSGSSAGTSSGTSGNGGNAGAGGGGAGSNAGAGGKPPDASAGSGGSDASGGSPVPDASTDKANDVAPEASADATQDAPVPPAETGPDAADPVAKICMETCASHADCVGKALSDTAPYLCDMASHRCVACTEDTACYAQFSQITRKCTSDALCGIFGDVCVLVNGQGRCAFSGTAPSCVADGGGNSETATYKKFSGDAGTGEDVTVCVKKTSTCNVAAGTCVRSCVVSGCVGDPAGTLCDTPTGKCGCSGNTDCAGLKGVSVCNTGAKRCECAGMQDCRAADGGVITGLNNVDVCVAGKCSCSGTPVCATKKYTATTIACE